MWTKVFLGVLVANAIAVTTAISEVLKPGNIEITFDTQVDPPAKICRLQIAIINIPRPETLMLRVMAMSTKPKSDDQKFIVGFDLDVGDMKFQNGIPA